MTTKLHAPSLMGLRIRFGVRSVSATPTSMTQAEPLLASLEVGKVVADQTLSEMIHNHGVQCGTSSSRYQSTPTRVQALALQSS